jgi:hypothetical protein
MSHWPGESAGSPTSQSSSVYDDAPEFPFEDPSQFGHPDEFGHEFDDEPAYRGQPAGYHEEELDEVEGGEIELRYRDSPGPYRDLHEEIDDEVDEEVSFDPSVRLSDSVPCFEGIGGFGCR